MGTVHWDTLCSYSCCDLFPVDMPWAEGVAGPHLPRPQLGGNTTAPRTEHRCWPPPRSLRNRKGQGCGTMGQSPTVTCHQAGRVARPPPSCPSFWGSHHHPPGLIIIPGPCQITEGLRGTQG